MPITNPNPIVVPSTTADALWIRNLSVNAPTVTGKISISAQVVPYSSSTGVMVPAAAKVLSIPDLYAAIPGDTSNTLAPAMTAIFAAIQAQIIAKNLFSAPVTPPTTS